jgi:hypothetical protein
MVFSRKYCLLAAALVASSANTDAFQSANVFANSNSNSNSRVSVSTRLPVTVIEEWQVQDNGCVVGKVRGSPDLPDGEFISTSPLANPAGASASTFVRSQSGSEYLLGSPRGQAFNAPRGTMPISGVPGNGGEVSRNGFVKTAGTLSLAAGAAALGYTFLGGDAGTAPVEEASAGEWTRMMPGLTDPTRETLTAREVGGLFGLWNSALQTGNPDTVAQRYAKEAVLLPTKSDIPRTDYDGIRDYFVKFLAKKPTGTILESYGT